MSWLPGFSWFPGSLRCVAQNLRISIVKIFNSVNSLHFLIATRCTAHCHFNRVQVLALSTEQAAPVLTDSFSRGHDPFTHACKARPLTDVDWTFLSVIVILIVFNSHVRPLRRERYASATSSDSSVVLPSKPFNAQSHILSLRLRIHLGVGCLVPSVDSSEGWHTDNHCCTCRRSVHVVVLLCDVPTK